MTTPVMTRRLLPLALTAIGLLAWSNLVVPTLPPSTGVRAVVNLAGVLGLVGVARASGLTWRELGIGGGTWRTGLRWGGGALALAGVGYGVLLAVAPQVLEGAQGAGASPQTLLLRALVFIPLGTVLAEELAFRGVLHAPAVRALPARGALIATSVVFGLWHLVTALGASGMSLSPGAQAVQVAGVIGFTALSGLLLGWLRHRTGSVLAPMGLHLGTNAVGLVAAAIALR